jgi:uncharacterized protein
MSTSIPMMLKELHRLRRHLRELQTELDLGPRVMKAQQDKLATEKAAHQSAHDAILRLKLKLKEDEISLQQVEMTLAKHQAHLNSAGSQKEYDAKKIEINHATTKKNELEDAILNGINDIEMRTADLPNVDKRWRDAQSEFEQSQRDALERIERMKADQAETQKKVEEAENQLPPTVKPQYDRLIKSYGPDGLAGVNGRNCRNCRTAITEQQRNNIVAGLFQCCARCGRALYIEEGTE